ncbi:MAG: hypothetical protein AAB583_00075 [Patescibacteria group bacterium]
MKKLFITISIIFFLLTNASKTYASENSSRSSAALLKPSPTNHSDNRAEILGEFLKQYNSPLTAYADDFVKYADKYNLDWKLVASISGVESTFGKYIPYNSYNGWGWGIYGNNVIYFSAWEEGIEAVSKGLRENYLNKWKAANVYEIGRIYAASPRWAGNVIYFMEKITELQYQNQIENLSISL